MACFTALRCHAALALSLLALFPALGVSVSSRSEAAEAWRHELELSQDAQNNEHMSFVTIGRGIVYDQILAMARVDADTSRIIDIHSAGSGKVTAVHVTPGQHVRQGQSLISYTDHSLHELALQREQVEAALASARAAETEARLFYDRGVVLVGSAVSRGELQRRLMVLEQQRDAVKAREADLATLNHRQTEEFTSVTERIVQDEASDLISPVDAVVQAIRTSVAADITAGDNLVTVVDLSRLWLIADLSPEDASQLSVGGWVAFYPSGQTEMQPDTRTDKQLSNPAGPETVTARIDTIAGLADPSTGLVRVVSVIDHPSSRLRPGMMLDAAFRTGEGVEGLVVPLAALQQIEGEDIVFLRRDATHFVPVPVRILRHDEAQAVIQGAQSQDMQGQDTLSKDKLVQGQQIAGAGSFALKSMALLSSMASD